MNDKPKAYVDRLFRMYHPYCYNNMVSTPEYPKPELNKILYNVEKAVCSICGERIYNK